MDEDKVFVDFFFAKKNIFFNKILPYTPQL